MKIVFTGGGSGGHILPNIALIKEIGSQAEMHYIGSNGMESVMLADYPQVTFHCYSPPKLKRQLSLSNLAIPYRLLQAIKQARHILQQIKPDIVFSKGGYVGLPIIIAASKLGIKCAGHEADMTLGLAHRLVINRYDRLFTTFDCTIKGSNVQHSGAILRQPIYRGDRNQGLAISGFDGKRPILLLLGGSLGASSLNEFYYVNRTALTTHYDCILISGQGKQLPSQPHFKVLQYCNQIEHLYACASACVSRGGANTLCELGALSIPFVAIPLANASRNEQIANSRYFEKLGVCKVLEQKHMTIDKLLSSINSVLLFSNKQYSKLTNIDGTHQVVDYLLLNKSVDS